MPWTKDNPPTVAKNWTADEQAKCVAAANAVIADGGSDQDAIFACIHAAGKSKQGAIMPNNKDHVSQFLFVELAITDKAKPFDGVAPGDFVDMWGREVTIDAQDFPKYLQNTIEAIAHTVTADGETVGLPIDAYGHTDDEAAGWIVGASLAEVVKPDGKIMPVIQFVANWTERGRELIEKGIRRMFSPTLNTTKKVILGGSLTNWPATRDDMGNVLLRPIALAEGATSNEVTMRPLVGTGFLYADSSTLHQEGIGVGNFTASAAGSAVGSTTTNDGYPTWVSGGTTDGSATITITNPNLGENNMPEKLEYTQEELDAMIAERAEAEALKLVQGLGTQQADPEPGEGEGEIDFVELFGLSHLEDEAVARIEKAMAENYRRMQRKAEEGYLRKLAEINRKQEMTERATYLTMGSEAHPRGLPIQADQLTAALIDLPQNQLAFWVDLLTAVVEQGLVEFAEMGNNKEVKGVTPLPEEFVIALRAGKMELSDLHNPILGLGNLSEYDLSEWQK